MVSLRQAADAVHAFDKQMKALQMVVEAMSQHANLEEDIKQMQVDHEEMVRDVAAVKEEKAKAQSELETVQTKLVRFRKEADTVVKEAEKRAAEMIAKADAKAQEMMQAAKEHVEVSMEQHGVLLEKYDAAISHRTEQLMSLEAQIEKMKEAIANLRGRLDV